MYVIFSHEIALLIFKIYIIKF